MDKLSRWSKVDDNVYELPNFRVVFYKEEEEEGEGQWLMSINDGDVIWLKKEEVEAIIEICRGRGQIV